VFMGFEHERIHFETSSVLIRQMPIELVKKPLGWKDGPIMTGKFLTPRWFVVDFFLFNMTGRHLGGKVYKGL